MRKPMIIFRLIASLPAVIALTAAATNDDQAMLGKWIASSKTAIGITGDVTIRPREIVMAGHSFKFTQAGTIQWIPASTIAQNIPAFLATLWRLADNGNPKLRFGNRLCTKTPRWIVAWVNRVDGQPDFLSLEVFQARPVATRGDDLNLCGGMNYFRPPSGK